MYTFEISRHSVWPQGLRLSAVTAILAGGLLVAATPDRAEAQFYPWGGWNNAQPWKKQYRQPRRVRRAPRQYVEPTNVKPTAALPKPSGPLVIVVSLNRQTLTVYDDGKQIARSPISSGKSSNPTPTGVFSILEKKKRHFSNLYNSAPMPFMQRLTNSGIAFHAGDLPGYPASHGCIRLPYSFARNLFEITEVGARVIVSNDDLTPVQFNSPGLINPLPVEVANNAGANAMQTSASGVSDLLIARANAASAPQVMTRDMATAARAAERERLANAVSEAENAKTAADEQVVAATNAVKEAKQAIKTARAEDARLAKEVRKTSWAATKQEKTFKALTAKLAKIDVSKLDAEALEKQSANELAEEKKVTDAVATATAAKKAASEQAAKTKQAVADAVALEKARKIAVDDAKHAVTIVADARKALAGADALEERKDMPVSVFVSAKTGRLTAKLGFVEVIDTPITIADEGHPLGTHVLTATQFTDNNRGLRWNAVTMGPNSSTPAYSSRRKRRHLDEEYVRSARFDTDPAHALERIQIPHDVSIKLAELMKPGSSFIISDFPLSRETSERTEFVVEPWRSRPDSSSYRYY